MQKEQYIFHKLTPEYVEEEAQVYKSALDYAYSEPDIKNIAITGIYGAGKSTLWKTYRTNKEKRDEWKNNEVISVALSNFMDENSDSISGVNSDNNGTNRIEKQIINQILYQIDKTKIKLSKYSVKESKTKWELVTQWLAVILSFLGFAVLFLRNDIVGIFDISLGALSMIALCILAYPIIRLTMWIANRADIRITKFNFGGAEGKVLEDEEEGVLDSEMKELVYLITASEAHSVVFEDLDRFNSVELFTRLRELNFLVNVKSSSTVRFIYMLRDDMFITKERTKFFDFIIPVVPYINSQNSKGKVIDLFSSIPEGLEKPSTKTLEKVSLYIDDMRLLYGIRNEYEIYSNEIDSRDRKLDPNKLFAILVLKNIFPQEFDRLQQDEGYIYYLLNKKGTELNDYVNKLETKIDSKYEEIKALNRLVAMRRTDLMAQYVPSTLRIMNTESISWREFLYSWSQKPYEIYSYANQNTSGYRIDFKGFEEILKKDAEYKKYIRIIENNTIGEEIKSIESDLNDLRIEKEKALILPLSELLKSKSKQELDDFFEMENPGHEITKDHYFPLIKFLLIEGLVDETYWHYKGYFYKSSLGKNDEIFLRKLLEGTREEPKFLLDNPIEVIDSLEETDFDRSGIFNLDLLNCLVTQGRSTYIYRMVRRVLIDDRLVTLIEYLESLEFENLEKFIKLLAQNNLDLVWKIIIKNSYIEQVTLRILVVLYSNRSTLAYTDDKFNEYTSTKSKVLELDYASENNNFYEGLESKGVKFKDLSEIRLTKSDAQIIENKGLFEVSIQNTLKLLNTIYDDEDKYGFEKLLTALFTLENFGTTKKRVSKSFEPFVEEYVEMAKNLEKPIQNDENQLLYVLNSDISIDIKKVFIEVNNTKVTNINDIKNSEFWKELVYSKRLVHSEANIANYWDEKPEDLDNIIYYLNDYYKNTEELKIPVGLADKLINNELICSKGFDDSLKYAENKINSINTKLSDEKIRKLIKNELVSLTKTNLLLLLEQLDTEDIVEFAIQYSNDFGTLLLEEDTMVHLSDQALYQMLNQNIFSPEKSFELIDAFNKPISLWDIEEANLDIQEYVLDSAFNIKDIEQIIEQPHRLTSWTVFSKKLNENIIKQEISRNELSKDFLEFIITDDGITMDIKVWMLIEAIKQDSLTEHLQAWMEALPELNSLSTVFDNKKPKINNNYEKQIAEALERIGVISISQSNNQVNLKPSQYEKRLAIE